MKIIRSIKAMANFSRKAKSQGKTIGLVPTMGALHTGHLSLMRQGRQDNDIIVVSIFVNPLQFGPGEDYRTYPRNLKLDASLCKKEGTDVIFYPAREEMYSDNYKTYVIVEDLSDVLCGKFRPGHFKGVATVVVRLLNIVRPDTTYFGQKDAQQAIIIKKMVSDLNIPVKIKVMPTVRQKDGLALSSRNAYLNQQERRNATVLYQALNLAKDLIRKGNINSLYIIRMMKQWINQKRIAKIQYISVVDLEELKPVAQIKQKVLIALAVYIGKTRLIDNIIINPN